MTGKWDVDDWITEAAATPIYRFYPTSVAKDTSLSLEETFTYLLEAVKDNRLKLYWEIRCPNLECVRSISVSPDKIISGNVTCSICGEEIKITPDIVFPIFEITPEYKARISQKKTKKNRVVFSMSRAALQRRLPFRVPCQ
ncbi:MAG: hypothetical protein A4E53_03527 [Pelotomaculum sp. PtaB.Bin104]|nr:MAG: hypothetical protein A4E53_03527 [Pelotomaculum sp. PtaB.Bin104]